MEQNLLPVETIELKRMMEWSDNALVKAKFVQNMSVD